MKLIALLLVSISSIPAQVMSTIAAGTGAPITAAGGIVLVTSVCGPASPNSGGGAANPINTSGADFVVIGTSYAATPITVTDVTYSNVITPLTAATNGSGDTAQLYYIQNPTVGSGHVFSVTGSGRYPAFCVMAFSGMATTGVYETSAAGAYNNSGEAIQPGALSPGLGNQLLITGLPTYISSIYTLSVNSGFSSPISIPFANGANFGAGMSYLIQSGNASQNPTWSATGNGVLASVAAVFQGM